MGFQEDFFDLLRKVMAENTQAGLADRAGLSQSQLSKLTGKGAKSKTNDPRLSTIARLLDVFDLTLCERGSADGEAQQTIKELREEISRTQLELEHARKEREQLIGQVSLLRDMLREKDQEAGPKPDHLISGMGKAEGKIA